MLRMDKWREKGDPNEGVERKTYKNRNIYIMRIIKHHNIKQINP